MTKTILPVLCLLFAVAGCSSHGGGQVEFESIDHSRTSVQRFTNAYITQGEMGEIDVVLVDSAADWDYKQPKKKQLQPIALAPLRQVMRIHMYWRPLTLTTKNPAAINSSVDWYVLGPEGSGDVLTYEGAAFVVLEGRGDTRRVRIKDGQIKPRANNSSGRLSDPVGPSKMHGEVVARISKSRVEDVINEIQQKAPVAGK